MRRRRRVVLIFNFSLFGISRILFSHFSARQLLFSFSPRPSQCDAPTRQRAEAASKQKKKENFTYLCVPLLGGIVLQQLDMRRNFFFNFAPFRGVPPSPTPR
jgi:hypothetical protein